MEASFTHHGLTITIWEDTGHASYRQNSESYLARKTGVSACPILLISHPLRGNSRKKFKCSYVHVIQLHFHCFDTRVAARKVQLHRVVKGKFQFLIYFIVHICVCRNCRLLLPFKNCLSIIKVFYVMYFMLCYHNKLS